MTSSIGTVAVFCGSNFGHGDVYREGMNSLGRALAGVGVRVVYGGTHKGLMGVLADGFIATPGGIGTLDELRAMWSLAQLVESGKPCALHNVAGFFDPLMQFVSHRVHAEFLKAGHRDMLVAEPYSAALIARLREYRAPTVKKWF